MSVRIESVIVVFTIMTVISQPIGSASALKLAYGMAVALAFYMFAPNDEH